MANRETWVITYQWFLILHESAFKRLFVFTFCVHSVQIVLKKQVEKFILCLKYVCRSICKNSVSVIHLIIIWLFVGVPSHTHGQVSFYSSDKN